MAGLHFEITASDEDFRKKIQNTRNAILNSGVEAEKTANQIARSAKVAASAYLGLFTINKSREFVNAIVQTRGQIQQLEISFTTMLKSGEKASALMRDLTQFAAKTPFGLMDSAKGAKQLLAYGSQSENLISELRMLGDVAAGTGQQLGDLVYLYGTLRTQGKAYAMDIRQFAGRGIPIYDELAKVLKINVSEVSDFVSAGKVGFKEVEQAFKNMTSSGSLYGGLMEAQSKSVKGRIEQLKDAIDVMFNSIGQSSEGAIYGAIEGANVLVENYEKVGTVLAGLVAAYGVHKASLMATAAIDSMVAASNGVFTRSLAARWAATELLQKAQARLNATMLANPYALATMAVVALGYGIYKLTTYQTELEKVTESYNKDIAKEQASIDVLFNKLRNAKKGTKEYESAKKDILNQYGQYLNGLSNEVKALNDIEVAYRAISDAAIQAAKDRAIHKASGEFTDEYSDVYAKEMDVVVKKLESKYTKEVVDGFKKEIDKALQDGSPIAAGKGISKELSDAINSFQEGIYFGKDPLGERNKVKNSLYYISLPFSFMYACFAYSSCCLAFSASNSFIASNSLS